MYIVAIEIIWIYVGYSDTNMKIKFVQIERTIQTEKNN
jgi:hypothetical protein